MKENMKVCLAVLLILMGLAPLTVAAIACVVALLTFGTGFLIWKAALTLVGYNT